MHTYKLEQLNHAHLCSSYPLFVFFIKQEFCCCVVSHVQIKESKTIMNQQCIVIVISGFRLMLFILSSGVLKEKGKENVVPIAVI